MKGSRNDKRRRVVVGKKVRTFCFCKEMGGAVSFGAKATPMGEANMGRISF